MEVCGNVTRWYHDYLPYVLNVTYPPGLAPQLPPTPPDFEPYPSFVTTAGGQGVIAYGAVSAVLAIAAFTLVTASQGSNDNRPESTEMDGIHNEGGR